MGLKLLRILKSIFKCFQPRREDMTYDEFSALEQKKYKQSCSDEYQDYSQERYSARDYSWYRWYY